MVYIQAEIKRALLRNISRNATKSSATLREALEAYQDQSAGAVNTGRIILNTSGGGYSTSLEMSAQWKQLTQEQVTGLTEEYLNVYDDALAALAISQPSDTSQDASILSTMLLDDRFRGVRSAMGDFTMLRAIGGSR